MKISYYQTTMKQLISDKECYTTLISSMENKPSLTSYEEKLIKIYKDELIRINNNINTSPKLKN